MDTGFAQVVSSTLGAITSIVVAIIAGYFTVKAAEAKNPTVTENNSSSIVKQAHKPKKPWSKIVLHGFIVGVIAMPLGFAIAYTGNSLYVPDIPSFWIVRDSLDPAYVSGFLSLVGFILGAWIYTKKVGMGKSFLLFLIVVVFSAPVAYSLAYTGNWLSGTPESLLFGDSADSMMVGALLCGVSFLLGILLSSRYSEKSTA